MASVTAPTAPTFDDVLDARRLLAGHLAPTPVRTYASLDRALGAAVVVKHENLQPTGAFKVRGALNLLLRSGEADRARGIVAYSTGNHAQALAHAARATGTPCTVVMPHGANPTKVDAVRDLGATLELCGANFDEAAVRAREIAEANGPHLVSAAGEPLLVAGVATLYAELLETVPDLDVLLVPVGGGSGAAGACLVAATLAPGCEVVAVQSAASPAAHDSWHAGTPMSRPNHSVAEGLATGSGFALTQQILRDHLDDFVTVTDDAILDAQSVLLRTTRTVAEGAGAAGFAALLSQPDRWAGRRVGIAVTGGNASDRELVQVLAHL